MGVIEILIIILLLVGLLAILIGRRRSVETDRASDAQAMADLHRLLERMEQRLQNLETIVIDRDKAGKL